MKDKPAFPCKRSEPLLNGDKLTGMFANRSYPGLTRREYFAIEALHGLLANPTTLIKPSEPGLLERVATHHADALIDELDGGSDAH